MRRDAEKGKEKSPSLKSYAMDVVICECDGAGPAEKWASAMRQATHPAAHLARVSEYQWAE